MASPTKTKETSAIRPRQKFEGHAGWVLGVIHLPDGRRIITCSMDGSLRIWNSKSGKQIGEDWRVEKDWSDEEDWKKRMVLSIASSPDGKKVVSGSVDGVVRLWDIDTGKIIAKWTGHTNEVASVCWSRDGRRVLSGSEDGTARQWDVESGETILKPIETGHERVFTAVYSPDMIFIATGGYSDPSPVPGPPEQRRIPSECYPIKIWDTKTGKLVATLKGHTWTVNCLAWTKDTLISGSADCSIRIWNTTSWKQTAVLLERTDLLDLNVRALAISPDHRILAIASDRSDNTARLWNLDNGQPISSPLEHAQPVYDVSFSVDGKQLATGCRDGSAYTWDVAAILKEAGLDDLLSDSTAKKLALPSNATPRSVQQRAPAHPVPHDFFDAVPPERSHSSTRRRSHSSVQPGSTFLTRLFHRNPSDNHDTSSLSSPLDWARNLLKPRRQSGENTELQSCSPTVVEVPCAPGKRRNACAREKRKRLLPLKNPTDSSSQPPKPDTTQKSGTATQTQPPLQPQPSVSNSSNTPAVGDNTAAASSTPLHPDVILRQAGLWTRFWLFIGCLSPEYQDGRHQFTTYSSPMMVSRPPLKYFNYSSR